MYLIYSKINKWNKNDNYLSIKCAGSPPFTSFNCVHCPTWPARQLNCIIYYVYFLYFVYYKVSGRRICTFYYILFFYSEIKKKYQCIHKIYHAKTNFCITVHLFFKIFFIVSKCLYIAFFDVVLLLCTYYRVSYVIFWSIIFYYN